MVLRLPSQSVASLRSTSRPNMRWPRTALRAGNSGLLDAPSSSYTPSRSARGPSHDVVLSSGFLAFAAHSGFLQAAEEAGVQVTGIMGTSAGALVGSLYAAGYTPRQVAYHLSAVPPIQLLRPSLAPWRGGLLTLDAVVERLRQLLPPTFEDLGRDFAVGVVRADGAHELIDSGPLAEAVAASAAIPVIFSNVEVPGTSGRLYKDGGVVDRIGLKAWRERRRRQLGKGARAPPALVHIIDRSSPFSGFDDAGATGEPDIHVVRSPKSGVNFFDLGNVEDQFDAARRGARRSLQASGKSSRRAVGAGASVRVVAAGGGGGSGRGESVQG